MDSPSLTSRSHQLAFLFCSVSLALASVVPPTRGAEAERPPSSWVWQDENGKLAYRATETGDRIPDFSHCGYMGGGVSLPRVRVAIELEAGSGDDAPRIQAAIDRLGREPRGDDGFRGAIVLQAGEWNIESPIQLRHSGIVLRGEGQDEEGTVLRVRGFEEAWSRVIEVGTSERWSEMPGTRQAVIEDYVPLGERSFRIADAAAFHPGDPVILELRRNEAWIRDIGMDRIPPRRDGGRVGQWIPRAYTHFYDRVVEKVEGDRITLDAPIGEAIRRDYGETDLYRYQFPERIEQVGIENMKAVAEFKGAPEDQREDHAWMFTYLQGVQNAWIRDITTRHFVFGAMDSSATAKWITIQDSRCLDPVSTIRGSRRYGFYIGGQLMLVQRCYGNDDRHAFAFSSRTPGPNAFLDCLSEGSHHDAGPHHRWSTAGLMDNVRVPDHSIRVQNRLHFGSGHGWAGANFVIWNCEAEHFMIHNPPIAKNWAIGLIGERRLPSHADPENYRRHTHPDHIAKHGLEQPPEWGFDQLGYSGWESLGQPVQPVSLYLRQLEDRLGPEAVRNIADRPYSFDQTSF
jgi:hypothetical protein